MVTRFFIIAVVLLVNVSLALSQAPGAPANASTTVSPDGSPILAEGPIAINLSMKDKRNGTFSKEDVTLLFITKDSLYYSNPKTGRVFTRPAKSLSVALIETKEPVTLATGKKATGLWNLDEKADPPAFTGDQLPLVMPDTTPRPGTKPLEQNWFLYYALARLQSRADTALASGDTVQQKVCSTRATEAAEHMGENRLDRAVAAAYAELPKYIQQQAAIAAALDQLYEDQIKKNRELIARAREAESKKRAGQLLGGLQVLGGFLNSSPYDVEYTDGTVRREYLSDPDVGSIVNGYGNIWQAQSAYQNEISRLAVAKEAFEAEAQRKYTEYHTTMTTQRAARTRLMRELGVERFQLEADAPIDHLDKAQEDAVKEKSTKPVVALFQNQVKYDRGTGPWDNPFALCDLYDAQARAVDPKSPTRSDELFALARQAADTVRLVPPGEIFAYERAALLRIAAQLACRAAIADTQQGFWCRTYSPRAAYAIRMLDLSGRVDQFDPTGEVREQRAVALLLVGRVSDALEQALAVGEQRATSAAYHYTLARLYSAQFLVAEMNGIPIKDQPKYAAMSLESLEKALKLGFRDIKDLKATGRDSDFFALFTSPDSRERAAQITTVSISYSIVPPASAGGSIVLKVTNNSPFAMTNLSGKFEMWGAGNVPIKPDGVLQQTPQLRPGREERFEIKAPTKTINRFKLSIVCDQGQTTATLESKK